MVGYRMALANRPPPRWPGPAWGIIRDLAKTPLLWHSSRYRKPVYGLEPQPNSWMSQLER